MRTGGACCRSGGRRRDRRTYRAGGFRSCVMSGSAESGNPVGSRALPPRPQGTSRRLEKDRTDGIGTVSRSIRHPASGIRHPASGIRIRHPASGIRHPASGIRHPASGIRHPASGIRHPASGIRHPASGIRHPASGIRHPASIMGAGVECQPNSSARRGRVAPPKAGSVTMRWKVVGTPVNPARDRMHVNANPKLLYSDI